MTEHSSYDFLHVAKKKHHHPRKELTVEEMLDDPIVQDLMRSDRVSPDDIKAALMKMKG